MPGISTRARLYTVATELADRDAAEGFVLLGFDAGGDVVFAEGDMHRVDAVPEARAAAGVAIDRLCEEAVR